jgi:HK97 family phage portal protein
MSISAVWACIRVLSESIATLPFSVYQTPTPEDIIPRPDHPMHALLHDRPSTRYNSFTFRETMMILVNLHGNAFAHIERVPGTGQIKGLRILDPLCVTAYDVEGVIWYIYQNKSEHLSIASYDMIHIMTMSQNGMWGISPIQACYGTFEEALDARKYQTGVTQNGARISGYIKYPTKLTDEAFQNLAKSWSKKYEGVENSGKTAILEQGAEFVPISMNNKDLQIIEQRRLTVEDISRVFRVPAHLINDLSRSTNNNIEHQSLEFAQLTLYPWVKRWETEINDKLFSSSEKNAGLYARLNLEGFKRGDSKSRADYYAVMHRIGAMSQNDIRKLEGFNPIPEGDTYYVQGAMIDSKNINDNETGSTD